MGIIGKVFGALGGPVLDLAKEAVKIVMDLPGGNTPEKQAAKLAIMQAADKTEIRLRELAVTEYEARVDMIKVEAQSEDTFVRRARPTFLYMMYTVIAFNFIVLPILGLFVIGAAPISLPSGLWYVFASGYLGYGYLRSKDKGSIADIGALFK